MSLPLHSYGPLVVAIMIALSAAALLPAPRVMAPSLTGRSAAAAAAIVVVTPAPVLM